MTGATPSHISHKFISIADQIRVQNRLLPSLSTMSGVNRTAASRRLRPSTTHHAENKTYNAERTTRTILRELWHDSEKNRHVPRAPSAHTKHDSKVVDPKFANLLGEVLMKGTRQVS